MLLLLYCEQLPWFTAVVVVVRCVGFGHAACTDAHLMTSSGQYRPQEARYKSFGEATKEPGKKIDQAPEQEEKRKEE
jgi:hypothetical protein